MSTIIEFIVWASDRLDGIAFSMSRHDKRYSWGGYAWTGRS